MSWGFIFLIYITDSLVISGNIVALFLKFCIDLRHITYVYHSCILSVFPKGWSFSCAYRTSVLPICSVPPYLLRTLIFFFAKQRDGGILWTNCIH
jgi:hypothetical protein